ncbi:MAG: COR domain-containing protein, partial [Pseudomonadota bacterium]
IGEGGARAIAEHLTGLTQLDLSDNNIGDGGTRAIAEHLTGLTQLDLYFNNIGEGGALAIAEHLTGLTQLDLSDNNIGEGGARAIAEHLTGLTRLQLRRNAIGEGGAQAIAEHLTRLTQLDLHDNGIGEGGGRSLLAAFLGRRLRILYLGDNPLTQTLLTPESFQTRDALTILAAWKAHTEAADSGRLQPLDEAKMLVLGDEAVGKTSLVRFITKGLPRDPDERATRGARLYDRITTDGWTPASTGVRLNVWDFGGQEIQHGTHRYFLTRRSLYLVVLEDRREDKGAARATKWLRVIESVAGEDAPVVLVVNKCDGPPQLTFDQDGLMRDFPQLKKVLRVSCNDDARSRESIAKLKEVIASLLTSGAMPHLSDQLPAEWLEVRNAIADMAEKTPVLDQDAYRALCTDDTVTKGREITDADEQRSLLRLLHDLGTVIAHGLERDAAVALSSVRLLDPNWLTTAIYTVLERIKVEDRAGEFSRSDLIDWLHPKLYPEEKHEFIIAMMRDPALELCFRLPSNEERFLAPEGLRENSPDYSQFTKEALRFRYRYAEVPRGLIPRLIVKLHDYLERPPQIWLTGGRFHIGGAMVIVEGDRIDRQIDISVLDEQRRAALFTLRQTMQNLHDNYREIGATAVVPMPDDPEIEERYDYLQQLEEEEGPDYRHRPSGAKRSYAVAELLDSIDEPRRVVRETVPPTHTAPPEREENQRPSQPRQTLLSLAILFPVGAAIFSFLGALRFGLDGFWSALLAFISFVCANFILRLFDRAFVFRRLLIAWVGSGLTLVAIGGIAAQLNIEGFSFDYGGAPTWTVAVIWAIGLLFLVVVAHFEAKREEARSMDRA